ncbi:hypothetical protein JCM19232_1504 [Vibrio ishigakensis]|uniref:Uncharacterized protein n=1 Tax=Vibrio ishigakensis TaxID=1481914 RepID=A0A0B8PFH1_9VIBR|nr:hypothetical protein JCM19232_1504 [Vibrio ishigakensis]
MSGYTVSKLDFSNEKIVDEVIELLEKMFSKKVYKGLVEMEICG